MEIFELNTTQMAMNLRTLKPFLIVAAAWLIIGTTLCVHFTPAGTSALPSVRGMLLLGGMCLIDLYALARALAAAFALMDAEGEKRGALAIQAFYWGMIKLICLGILGAILLQNRSTPGMSLLLGSLTLVVVPLFGGYWWSQKVLRHA